MPNDRAQRRQWAIDCDLAGEPIEDICREVACSKSWLYKWRDRYLATDPAWSDELSRRPKTNPTQMPKHIEQTIVSLRQTLAQNGKGCGAASIKQALEQQGIAPVPSPRTIYRILQRYEKEVK
jgi:transposase-like protein